MFGLVASTLGAPVASAGPTDPPIVNTALPVITGTAKVGEKLNASGGTWEPDTATLTYQWLSAGAPVGAAEPSYTVTSTDLGRVITVAVKATATDRADTTATSLPTAKVVAGTLTAAVPTISGTATVGSTLTAAFSGWSAMAKPTYQWYANGKAISKATGTKLKLGNSQAGKRITVKVTGKLPGYTSASRVSSATAKVLKVLKSATPKISGSAKVGSKLKIKAGSWTSKTKKSYQWLRDGAAIRKATKSTYKLTSSDAGKKVSVKVTGKRSGYTTVSRTSKTVSVRLMSLKVGSPKVSGTAAVGRTLTVSPGSWTSGTTLKYQWYADGVKVARGTGKSLRPGYLEAGRVLKVTVTGSKAGYSTTSKTATVSKRIPTDAVYVVGVDIPAVDLIGAGASYKSCRWWRVSSLDGDFMNANIGDEGLLGYRSVIKGQALATVFTDDPYFVSVGCGRWSHLSAVTPAPKTFLGDGDFAVGIHVQPGTYETTGATPSCYVEWATGSAGTNEETDWWEPMSDNGEAGMWFREGLVRVSSQDCGTWTRVGDPPAPSDTARSNRIAPAGVTSGMVQTERRPLREKFEWAGLR